MLNLLNPFFYTFLSFRIYDVFDVLIFSGFLYILFTFTKQSKIYTVVFGIAVTCVLYLVSKYFDFSLTYASLRYTLSYSVFLFVVIFQKEIRKYFEYIGLISFRRINNKEIDVNYAKLIKDEVVLACSQMSKQNIGALFVIEGNDNIESYVYGGTVLDGMVSADVILSIFDPHSEGHDGAILIENNRISKFAAQLPMSKNFKELGKLGMRHSAALGITELIDCLTVVVSEQKGTISIGHDGKLKLLSSPADLEKELTKYLKSISKYTAKERLLYLITHNLNIKLLSVFISLILWGLLNYL